MAERMTDEQMELLESQWRNWGFTRDEQEVVFAEAERARARESALEAERAAMWDALMKAQWAFRHACNGCDCQRVAAEAVDAVLEAHEVLP